MRDEDISFLNGLGLAWSVHQDGRMANLIIEDWPVPAGLSPSTTALLVRLPATFNDAAPDMFWCNPPVSFAGGTAPAGTEVRNNFHEIQYQRWSRHIGPHWRPGVDNLQTYLGYVRRAMGQEVEVAA